MSTPLCEHDDFEVFARVARIGNGPDIDNPQPPWRYMADLHVRCAKCMVRFRWLGVEKTGLSFSEPRLSVDALELRAPIGPDAHASMLMAGDADLGWPG